MARNALKKTGATGMKIAVDDCYRSAARQRGESAVLRCYAIQRSAGDLDEAFSRISGVDVREPSLTKGAALVRAINALKDRGVPEDTAHQTIAIWDFYGREDN
ncbi:hypothetical protein OICFNHDK_3789 [Methylobacterium bullatum]|uniref:Uncharacterized protein n=1 Tax=Methylobacterium bullatum TaxID=570505 RepID=A0AAV4ZBQ6_9HYPH|nr:hypothetical protein OICFNHDK_3789 [Methylobacterium bullatum]